MQKFPPLLNDRILKAARGETPDKIPVWVMRQAGRYLSEFQEIRKKHTFFEICESPALACEVTLMPLKHYELDAAIIFSDILVIAQALGLQVEMKPEKGPVVVNPLTLETLKDLTKSGAATRLTYVGEAITLTRQKLEGKVPLFGFAGAPWTLMSYMIEGGTSKTWSKAKKWLYRNSEESVQLLGILTEVIADFLVMQIEHGAQIVQVFDSNAGYLNKDLYAKYGLPYLKQIREQVHLKLTQKNIEPVPMVLFAKGACYCLAEQADLGYDVIGIDWTVEPQKAREILKGKKVTLQGNLDPCALYANEQDLTKMTESMISNFGPNNYIANLGHGIYPDTPVESVTTFPRDL